MAAVDQRVEAVCQRGERVGDLCGAGAGEEEASERGSFARGGRANDQRERGGEQGGGERVVAGCADAEEEDVAGRE